MNRDYFQSLEKERLVEVATNLHKLAVEQWEKLQQNSKNSSRPPSSDNPYNKADSKEEDKTDQQSTEPEAKLSGKEISAQDEQSNQDEASGDQPHQNCSNKKRAPGHQPGTPSQWRSTPLVASGIVPHYPSQCAACAQSLSTAAPKPYMGHYVLELEREDSGFRVVCQLHHYYEATCSCGHISQAKPGKGYVSVVVGRTRDLKLTEYVLVGPFLATLIASLAVRYRISRAKIQEFLSDWAATELGIGTIDRCIREAGIACVPVVDQLVEELQEAEILHLDETPWYVKGRLHWLWVAITTNTAVFHIGSRKKEELAHLVTEAFVGWLVTDGYKAYRHREKRQRCLAHLIRKAIAISGAVGQKAAKIGQWILTDLRDLIEAIAQKQANSPPFIGSILRRLCRACHLGEKVEHPKLRALAREILNDWDAVVAFVNHPELPPTNNEAERALRHAVIARRLGYGTRTSEGSLAYSSLLSVIETCRLRNIDPWTYLAEVIALARRGLSPPPVPAGNVN